MAYIRQIELQNSGDEQPTNYDIGANASNVFYVAPGSETQVTLDEELTAIHAAIDNIKIDTDITMSDTSTKPVQNKTIKKYVDNSFTIAGRLAGSTLGDNATAEGISTVASQKGSHTEGYQTTANGIYSHAEGEGTVAIDSSQHVQGKYNQSKNNVAFIIGNGTDDTHRSNALEVDQNGNLKISGEIDSKGVIKVLTLPDMNDYGSDDTGIKEQILDTGTLIKDTFFIKSSERQGFRGNKKILYLEMPFGLTYLRDENSKIQYKSNLPADADIQSSEDKINEYIQTAQLKFNGQGGSMGYIGHLPDIFYFSDNGFNCNFINDFKGEDTYGVQCPELLIHYKLPCIDNEDPNLDTKISSIYNNSYICDSEILYYKNYNNNLYYNFSYKSIRYTDLYDQGTEISDSAKIYYIDT